MKGIENLYHKLIVLICLIEMNIQTNFLGDCQLCRYQKETKYILENNYYFICGYCLSVFNFRFI